MSINDVSAAFAVRLGAVIAETRRLRGFSTQHELATALGRSVATVQRWESGRTLPSAWDLAVLVEALDAPAELFLRPPEKGLSPVEAALTDAVRRGADRGAPKK